MTSLILSLYRIQEPPIPGWRRALKRFLIRFRNRMPLIWFLYRSTWADWAE